jgi:hypothetical protein
VRTSFGHKFLAPKQGNCSYGRVCLSVSFNAGWRRETGFLAPRLHSLPNLDIQHTWFQQDGATSHTARQSMAAGKRLFGDRIISRNSNIVWPPRSPDLSVCDCFLWGHLKSVVYQTRPTNLAQLKTRIEDNTANIPENTSRRAMQNLQNRLTECVQRNGQHLTDVIFKK